MPDHPIHDTPQAECYRLRVRVKELEAQKSVLKEQRDMAKDELSMHGGTLVERIRKLKDEWAKIHRERDHANMVADAADAKIKELQAHRVPNPGVVGTLQDKNTLLEYKDAQIARLQARVQELEARTSQQCKCADRLETELADATKAED